MADPIIRIYHEDDDGTLNDGEEDMNLSDFGGVLPASGDLIFSRWVDGGRDRNDRSARKMWEVLRRVYNPRDHGDDYIALIIRERALKDGEVALMP